jgi:hypothetical protein
MLPQAITVPRVFDLKDDVVTMVITTIGAANIATSVSISDGVAGGPEMKSTRAHAKLPPPAWLGE